MKNNIELFTEYYKKEKKELEIIINDYNINLLKNKDGYLKENLNLFVNLNKDGKLIRGILILLGYRMIKGETKYSYPLALAYEIFQTSVLIHDDVIDNDNQRRGKDTIHYANYKKNKNLSTNAKKSGESVAICIGDYGFFDANRIINDSYRNDVNFYKVFNYYNDIVLKTIEGELIDVELSFDGRYRLENKNLENDILKIYKLKTAFYTIIGPLSLGLILGGIQEDRLEEIKIFGEKVGIAFQIQDDILGIYSDMGKVNGSDIKEYKETLLYSYTIKDEKYKNELLKYYGKSDIKDEEIEEVRRIFKESGAFDYANNLMNKLYDEGVDLLKNINWINQNDKNLLFGFIEYLRKRKK